MSLSDLKKKKPSTADPAHAFGSEEQVMEEFRRQSFVPPRQEAANRAGSLISSLREKLSPAEHAPRQEAPVYGADTYDRASAPDMGWEAAFSDQPAPAQSEDPQPQQDEPKKGLSFEEFKNTVYASPYQAVYDTFGQSYYPPQSRQYYPVQQAYYPEQQFYPPQQPYYPPQEQYYPPQQTVYPPQQTFYPQQEPYYPPQQAFYPQQEPYYPPQQAYYPPQESYYQPPQPQYAAPQPQPSRQPIYDADRDAGEEPGNGGLFAELPVMGRQPVPAPEVYGAAAEQPLPQEGAADPGLAPGDPGMSASPIQPTQPLRRRGSDFGYYFWSGSILAGAALTVFAFIYACLI